MTLSTSVFWSHAETLQTTTAWEVTHKHIFFYHHYHLFSHNTLELFFQWWRWRSITYCCEWWCDDCINGVIIACRFFMSCPETLQSAREVTITMIETCSSHPLLLMSFDLPPRMIFICSPKNHTKETTTTTTQQNYHIIYYQMNNTTP